MMEGTAQPALPKEICYYRWSEKIALSTQSARTELQGEEKLRHQQPKRYLQ